MNNEDNTGVVLEVLDLMESKINKSLYSTKFQEREDLKQEIKLKAIQAVRSGRIVPIDFWEFKNNFNK